MLHNNDFPAPGFPKINNGREPVTEWRNISLTNLPISSRSSHIFHVSLFSKCISFL